MNILDMSDKEKEEILTKHKAATKEVHDRKAAEKGGPAIPEAKKEEKKGD